jgi:cysteine desulfurase
MASSLPAGYVYFDHNATTPLDPRVLARMLPWLGEQHGNPSSAHRAGQAAREAVEAARAQIAGLLGADPLDVVFAASGTEANNAVIHAVGRAHGWRGEIVVASFEHPSVRRSAERCVEHGMTVRVVTPGADGVVAPAAVLAAIGPETRLVCLMLANNEIGTLQPVMEVAAACRERGVAVLCDAVQAVGKVPVEVGGLGVDYLTLGGHKFHGPLGGAAVWVRPGAAFDPYLVGGSQERRRRASTLDVPAAVGLGEACDLARQELPARRAHLLELRERFEAGLAAIPGAVVHCAAAPRLPHTSNVAFLGVVGHSLAIRLDLAGFAVSTGAACHSGVVEPSETLLAIGVDPAEALASLRVSFGMTNAAAEVDAFLAVLAREVAALRAHAGARSAAAPRAASAAAAPVAAEVLPT